MFGGIKEEKIVSPIQIIISDTMGVYSAAEKVVHKKPNMCYRGLDGITASYLVQIQGVGLKNQQYK